MTKNNKELKARRQRGRDAASTASINGASPTLLKRPSVTKTGAPLSQSKPIEPWDKTSERAAIGRRSKLLKVTLPKMPWDNNEE